MESTLAILSPGEFSKLCCFKVDVISLDVVNRTVKIKNKGLALVDVQAEHDCDDEDDDV